MLIIGYATYSVDVIAFQKLKGFIERVALVQNIVRPRGRATKRFPLVRDMTFFNGNGCLALSFHTEDLMI